MDVNLVQLSAAVTLTHVPLVQLNRPVTKETILSVWILERFMELLEPGICILCKLTV